MNDNHLQNFAFLLISKDYILIRNVMFPNKKTERLIHYQNRSGWKSRETLPVLHTQTFL
jgi:hypothetical protein